MAKTRKVKKIQDKKNPKADDRELISAKTEKILNKEIFLELRLNHLEREKLQTEMAKVNVEIENFQRGAIISTHRRSDLKARLGLLEKAHDEFLDSVERKTGINIRGKTINPETYEVI